MAAARNTPNRDFAMLVLAQSADLIFVISAFGEVRRNA